MRRLLQHLTHTEMLLLPLSSELINAELRRIVSLPALFCLAPLSAPYNFSVSSLQWSAYSQGQGEKVCVCVLKPYKAGAAYHCHAACVQEENVKLVWNFQVGALMMEPWSEGKNSFCDLYSWYNINPAVTGWAPFTTSRRRPGIFPTFPLPQYHSIITHSSSCAFFIPFFSNWVWGTGWRTTQPTETIGIYSWPVSFCESFFSSAFWGAKPAEPKSFFSATSLL